MNKYSELSDFEINKRVAEALGYPHESEVSGVSGIRLEESFVSTHFNPCHSWADGGPIIEKYGIDILNGGKGNLASSDLYGYLNGECGIIYAVGKSALRAAMEVFLMMEDAKNDK